MTESNSPQKDSRSQNDQSFVDILVFQRKNSTLLWASRFIDFTKPYLRNGYKMKANDIEKMVLHIMKEGSPDVTNIAEVLNKFGFRYNLTLLRMLGFLLTKILQRTINSLFVNEVKILELKKSMGHCPVVFVPTHRSYADFILMAYVCFHYDLEIPCVAAGSDFESMWLVGRMLRECKAFFMRRKFSGDENYKTLFKQYVRCLVSYGHSPLEFFIEGTRSRCGKSLQPKYGFLSMVAEAYLMGDVPDIMFVPISISYDRLLEEKLFVYELLGIPKPKESTKGLLKSVNIMKENYGSIHFNFGDPIYIRDFVAKNGDQKNRSKSTEFAQIQRLARKISFWHQRQQVIRCVHLFSIVMHGYIMEFSRYKIPFDVACDDVATLRSVFLQLGAVVLVEDVRDELTSLVRINSGMFFIDDMNEIGLIVNPAFTYTELSDNVIFKGMRLSPEVLSQAVPMCLLQIYANAGLHFIFTSAVLLNIATAFCADTVGLLHVYTIFYDMFRSEFLLPAVNDLQVVDDTLKLLISWDCITLNDRGVFNCGSNKTLIMMLRYSLVPFVQVFNSLTYILTCDISDIDLPSLTKFIQEHTVHDLFITHRFKSPYSLSMDLIHSAINSLISRKIIAKENNLINVTNAGALKEIHHASDYFILSWLPGVEKCKM